METRKDNYNTILLSQNQQVDNNVLIYNTSWYTNETTVTIT